MASRDAKDASKAEMLALKDKHRAAMLAWTAQQKGNKDAAEAAARAKKQQEGMNSSVYDGVKAVGMMGAAMVGLGSASAVLATIAERFENIRKAALEAARNVVDQQGDLRGLAALQGRPGDVASIQAQQLALRSQTFQTEQDAVAMSVKAWASGAGAISQGLISDPEFQKSLIGAGKLQTLTGDDAGSVGRMAGLLPLISGQETNTAEGLGALQNQLYEIGRLGGFESYGQSVEQLGAASPYVMKGIYTAPVAQSLLSAFAHGGEGAKSAEYLAQATRAVSAGLLRDRGVKPAAGYEQDMMRSGKYFKSLGVDTQMRPEERMMAVVKDLLRAEDESKAQGKYFMAYDYLMEKGFVNQEDKEALAKLAGVQRVGLLEPLLNMGRAPTGAGGQQNAAFAKAVGTQPFYQREAAKFAAGTAESEVGGRGMFREIMEQNAYASLGGKTRFGEDLGTIQGRAWYNPMEMIYGARKQVDFQAQHMVLNAAEQAGIKRPDTFNYDSRTGVKTTERQLSWEELFNISEKTRAAGGAFAAGPDQERVNKSIDAFTAALDRFTAAQPTAKGGAAPATAQPAIPIMPTPRRTGGNNGARLSDQSGRGRRMAQRYDRLVRLRRDRGG